MAPFDPTQSEELDEWPSATKLGQLVIALRAEMAAAKKDTALLDAIDAIPNPCECIWQARRSGTGGLWLERNMRSNRPPRAPANIRSAMSMILGVKP